MPAEETLSAHVDPDSGALVLTSMTIDWSLGSTGATKGPHAIHLQPTQAFDAPCEGPNDVEECTLECADDPSGKPVHQRVSLSCMEPFEPEECVVVVASDSGELFKCERGCHAVDCALEGDGALNCSEIVTDQECGGAARGEDG